MSEREDCYKAEACGVSNLLLHWHRAQDFVHSQCYTHSSRQQPWAGRLPGLPPSEPVDPKVAVPAF